MDEFGFVDPSREEGWIPQTEAEKLLGLPAGEMMSWDYIEAEQWGANRVNWVKLLPKYRAAVGSRRSAEGRKTESGKRKGDSTVKCKVSNAKCKVEGETGPVKKRRSRWDLYFSRPFYFGIDTYTVQEAAAELGLSETYVRHMALNRLNAFKRDGRLWIPTDEVERYREKQAYWAERGGQWTAYGRQWKKGREPIPEPEPELTLEELGEPVGGNIWITTAEAAANLGLSKCRVYELAKAGALSYRVEYGPDRKRGRGHRLNQKRHLYNLAEVLKLAMRRAEAEAKQMIPPSEFGRYRRHPIFRSWRNVPESVRLILTREAMAILGVSHSTLRQVVDQGKLFVWCRYPGRQGIPWFFSEDQVRRYAADPQRLERQRRQRAGRKEPEYYAADGLLKEWAYWKEEHKLLDHHPGPKTGKDYGEYFTTSQAARVLGVSYSAVRTMRLRRRLKGYRVSRPRVAENLQSYWFFRKEDIYALRDDSEYQKRRATFRRSQTPESRAARDSEWFQESEYIPHDPANVRFLDSEARRRLREERIIW